tara:strand:+ start:789 stop:1220 length:432 start_codon:yes stop_codon:yes gene_type:complete
MNFNCPIPRAKQPGFHESSSMRSVRDGDANSKQWQKNKTIGKAVNAIAQTTEQNSRQIQKLRRRIVGGGVGSASGMIFRGEYSTDLSYNPQDVVVIRSGPNAGSYVCILANDSTDPQSPIIPDTNGLYWISLTGNVTSMGQWL